MDKKNSKNEVGLFKSVMLAYGILTLHIILVAMVGLVVVFFQGIAKYWIWIFIGIIATIIGCTYYIYRRVKSQGKTLGDILKSPAFSGKSVEVSVLGGLASLKIGEPKNSRKQLAIHPDSLVPQLEDPDTTKVREVLELARLLEKNLITPEEYHQAKQKLLKG
jgi:hypothetical protein